VFSLRLSPLLFYRREPPQRFGNGLRQGSEVVIGRKQIPKPRRCALLELFDPVIVWWPSLMTMTVHGFPLGLITDAICQNVVKLFRIICLKSFLFRNFICCGPYTAELRG